MKEFLLEDFLTLLEQKGMRYLLIGGQAATAYGSPLVSFDFDFWIDPSQKDAFIDKETANLYSVD